MTLLLDSSTWIEYLTGNRSTKTLRFLVETPEPILLSTINLLEIYEKYLQRSQTEADQVKESLLARCQLVEIDKEIAIEGARLKNKHHLATADALILASARSRDARLVTFDSDFEGLRGVQVLKHR